MNQDKQHDIDETVRRQTVEAVRLQADGLSVRQIAAELGISPSTVQRRLKGAHQVGGVVIPAARATDDLGSINVAQVAEGKAFTGSDQSIFGTAGSVIQPEEDLFEWSDFGLDAASWEHFKSRMNLPRMVNMSPGMNRVKWDFTRLLDPGHEVQVFRTDTDGDEIHDDGTALLDRFMEQVIDPVHGNLTGMIQKISIGLLYRGAAASQVLVDDANYPAGFLVPDPDIIRFRAEQDDLYGMRWVPGVMIKGKWQSVESDLFHYMAFDAHGDSPYGTAVLGNSNFASFFILAMLWDIRRVTSQQGYSHRDVTVDTEMIRAMLPPDADPKDVQRKVDQVINAVSGMVSQLQPDNAFVHTDGINMTIAEGAVDDGMIGGVAQLMEVLERLEVRGLKTMPLLMGISDGVSEANANRQWEIFIQGIKHMQHLIESMLERQFKMILRLYGVQARVVFRFAEARSAEMLRDEQTAEARMGNAAFAYDRGWISHEEAALYAVGHEPTGSVVPEPAGTGATGGGSDADTLDEPVDDGGPEDDGGGQDRSGDPMAPDRPVGRLVRFYDRMKNRRVTQIGRTDIDHAARAWRSLWGESPIGDMLDAPAVDVPEQADPDGWSWIRQTREFVYRAEETYDSLRCRQLLGQAREEMEQRLQRVMRGISAQDALQRDLSEDDQDDINDRADEAWTLIFLFLLMGSVQGRGGTGQITADDYPVIESELQDQYGYWESMESDLLGAEDMADAERFMDWRFPLYLYAGYRLYESMRAEAWDLAAGLPIPLHPSCDCYAEYGVDDNGPWVTWVIEGASAQCDLCAEMAADYQTWRGYN